MKSVCWIGFTLLVPLTVTVALAGDAIKPGTAHGDTITQTRTCSSCTARHQDRLKKKKQREEQALKDAAKKSAKPKE